MHVRHFLVYFWAGPLSPRTVQGSIWSNNLVHELTHGLLVLPVGLKEAHTIESDPSDGKLCTPYLLKVGAIVAGGEPRRLSVRYQRCIAGAGWNDQRFFIFDGADY